MNSFAPRKRLFRMGLVLCLALVFTGCGGPGSSEDPNWKKTHVTVTSVEEAVKQFGSDLLLDKLVLTEDYGKPYTEFILEHTGESGEAWKDRKTWMELSAQVDYGQPCFSAEEGHVGIAIYPDRSSNTAVNSKKVPEGMDTTTLNGIPVIFHAFSEQNTKYGFSAEFEYNGFIYHFSSYSNKNPNLAWDTLHQMLGASLTHY